MFPNVAVVAKIKASRDPIGCEGVAQDHVARGVVRRNAASQVQASYMEQRSKSKSFWSTLKFKRSPIRRGYPRFSAAQRIRKLPFVRVVIHIVKGSSFIYI